MWERGAAKKHDGAMTLLTILLAGALLQAPAGARAEPPPTVGPGELKEVRDTTATVQMMMPATGGQELDVTVFYGKQDAGTKEADWEHRRDIGWSSEEPGKQHSVTLEDLERQTQYFYRVMTSNAEGSTWSEVGRFRTEAWIMPWWVILLIVAALLSLPFLAGSYVAKRFRMPDHGWKIGLILCTVASGIVVVVFGWPPKFGIDLSGGVILVYEVDQDKKKPDEPVNMDKLIAAVSRRVNPGGVREVTIRKYGAEQIEIIIPEADENELRRMKKILSSVGSLEFRILANRRDHPDLIERARRENTRVIQNADGSELGRWVPVQANQEASFNYPEIATRIRQRGDHEILEVLVVKDDFNVTGDYLTQAVPGVDRHGRPCVEFAFGSKGAQLFGGLTGANLPDPVQDFTRKLGIILDGYLYSAPAIQSTIFDRGEITGSFTQQEVEDLVNVLNAGSLPAALDQDPISEMVTGPTLGRDTIRRGGWTIAVSMALVLVFMLFYYRFAGFIACMALLTNLVLILAIMITIKAAFTLPGLAGLVLTVGMAVDANVLIFERIREELQRGAALRMAIRNGFARATSAIVDASVTTLITATVLYWIGTDQVKGFAVTLWLGVILSMYTAIFCSRVVFDVAERRRWITALKMLRILGGTQIDFLGMRRVAWVGSLAVILIGLVGVGLRGAGLLDIDFTGGVRVEVLFREPQRSITDVRTALSELPDLAVSDVQIQGEPPRKRFMVNTSQQDITDESAPNNVRETAIEYVEDFIQKRFPDQLDTNSVEVGELAVIAPDGQVQQVSKVEKPAGPKPTDQSRGGRPPGGLLAATDPAVLLVAQVGAPAAEPSADEAEDDGPAAPAQPAANQKGAGSGEPGAEPRPDQPTPPTEPPEEPQAEPGGEPPPQPAPGEEPSGPAEPTAAGSTEGPDQRESPFAGWTQAELTFAHSVNHDTLSETVAEALKTAVPERPGVDFDLSNPDYVEGEAAAYDSWTVRLNLPPAEAQKVFEATEKKVEQTPFFPSSNTIGGKVADSTRTAAIAALLSSLLGIVLYLWVRFQRVVFGLAAVIALVHDVLVTLGVVALSYWLSPYLEFLLIDPFKIGLSVLSAFLTIIGYSLNDTIVVFDRIREVRGKAPQLTGEMVNTSINQTLSRTLLTSLTTLLVVVILYVFGGQAIHGFAFALVIGVLVGTYSSVFVASPALLWMSHPARAK